MNSSSRDDLQKRYDGLESTAMMMALQGLAIPSNISEEIFELREQLDRAGNSPEPRTWTQWLGRSIEGFTLKERISSGTYCNVFRAEKESTKEPCVFKIAISELPVSAAKDYFVKQAISLNDEICGKLDISANQAIEQEFQRLQMDMSGHFVPAVSAGYIDSCFYYRMPLIEGQTFKELMKLPDVPFLQLAIEIFSRLGQILEKLGTRGYHGNLQPDNILVSKNDIFLLSPGSFELSDSGTKNKYMLCSPAYYPFFEPNDLFSLGLTFWEAILKEHPLANNARVEKWEQFADELRQMFEYRKSLNHEPLVNFLRLATPKELREELSDSAEVFMMKAVKLAYQPDGLITGCPGFKNPAEFVSELQLISKRSLLR